MAECAHKVRVNDVRCRELTGLRWRSQKEKKMRRATSLGLAGLGAGVALFLSACGGGSSSQTPNTSGAQGTLLYNPPLRVGSVTAAAFTAQLNGSATGQQLVGLLTQAGMLPLCGIDFHYIQYGSVGGAGEATTASGALMVPTGPAGTCSGNRPILLYAHGTAATRSYNMANPSDTTNEASSESALVAAMFAAQGYIVVAPNYAGYDSSPLPYHPFLIADALSKDMINALLAARTALGNIQASGTVDGGRLFISGYSEGGYVAMATHRAMQARGMTVTASAPMSGPYAVEALTDAIIFGNVDIAGTVFFPLFAGGYQNTYHNLYNATTDMFALPYATGIESLMPGQYSFDQLIALNKVPVPLFSSTTPATGNAGLDAQLAVPNSPLAPYGFGNPFLVNNSIRLGYALDVVASPDGALASSPPPPGAPLAASPMYPFRQDLKLNDLRNGSWVPGAPTLMCGGHSDPEVFFLDAQVMQAFWAPLPLPTGLINLLDVDSPPTSASDPFAAVKVGFTTTRDGELAAKGAAAVVKDYHGKLVPPFCTLAAAGFFKSIP
jgi:hypothetical protein